MFDIWLSPLGMCCPSALNEAELAAALGNLVLSLPLADQGGLFCKWVVSSAGHLDWEGHYGRYQRLLAHAAKANRE